MTYEATKSPHRGWVFTLTPQDDEFGNRGYLLRHLAPSEGALDWARQEPINRFYPSVAQKIEQVRNKPDEWREELWLTEWLKSGAIRLVTP